MDRTKQVFPLILLCMVLIGCTLAQGTIVSTALPTHTTSPTDRPNAPAASQTFDKPVDLQTAEEKAGFEMILPTVLPENYQYRSANYLPEQEGIFVQYVWNHPKSTGEMLFFTQQRKTPAAQKEAAAEKVQIGNSQGVFYQGGMFDTGWEAEAPFFTLNFTRGDFYYSIQFNGNERSSAGWINKEEMMNMASQIHR